MTLPVIIFGLLTIVSLYLVYRELAALHNSIRLLLAKKWEVTVQTSCDNYRPTNPQVDHHPLAQHHLINPK